MRGTIPVILVRALGLAAVIGAAAASGDVWELPEYFVFVLPAITILAWSAWDGLDQSMAHVAVRWGAAGALVSAGWFLIASYGDGSYIAIFLVAMAVFGVPAALVSGLLAVAGAGFAQTFVSGDNSRRLRPLDVTATESFPPLTMLDDALSEDRAAFQGSETFPLVERTNRFPRWRGALLDRATIDSPAGPLSDVYLAALLAGGPERVAQAVVARLLVARRVAVNPLGYLLAVDDQDLHALEATAFGFIRDTAVVCASLGAALQHTPDLEALESRLQRAVTDSSASRRALLRSTMEAGPRALRLPRDGHSPLDHDDQSLLAAATIALYGPRALADRSLRNRIFYTKPFIVSSPSPGGG